MQLLKSPICWREAIDFNDLCLLVRGQRHAHAVSFVSSLSEQGPSFRSGEMRTRGLFRWLEFRLWNIKLSPKICNEMLDESFSVRRLLSPLSALGRSDVCAAPRPDRDVVCCFWQLHTNTIYHVRNPQWPHGTKDFRSLVTSCFNHSDWLGPRKTLWDKDLQHKSM